MSQLSSAPPSSAQPAFMCEVSLTEQHSQGGGGTLVFATED